MEELSSSEDETPTAVVSMNGKKIIASKRGQEIGQDAASSVEKRKKVTTSASKGKKLKRSETAETLESSDDDVVEITETSEEENIDEEPTTKKLGGRYRAIKGKGKSKASKGTKGRKRHIIA